MDGNADPDTMNEHCSHTEDHIKNRVASWSVDLQGLYYISSIKITNRLDGMYNNLARIVHMFGIIILGQLINC